MTFLVLISNTVQVILQTFQQRYQELLCILLTAHTNIQSTDTAHHMFSGILTPHSTSNKNSAIAEKRHRCYSAIIGYATLQWHSYVHRL